VNRREGIIARRGDGSFGEIIPHEAPVHEAGYVVKRGRIVTTGIGVEVKIVQSVMIRQTDFISSKSFEGTHEGNFRLGVDIRGLQKNTVPVLGGHG
jgi:hypothetical protein